MLSEGKPSELAALLRLDAEAFFRLLEANHLRAAEARALAAQNSQPFAPGPAPA